MTEIEKAAEECRKAFEGVEVGAVVMHCHHGEWLEILNEPAENRIQFILEYKDDYEQAERLRKFRPFIGKIGAKWQEAYAKWQEACAKRQEAYAKQQEAYAKWQERQEAYAKWQERQEAYAKWQERQEAYAKWQEAYAKRQEAYAKWQEACAKRQEACAKWQEAYAKWQAANSPEISALHKQFCGCPWSEKTDIFGNSR